MRPHAILFDLDGTLLDTAPNLHMALNKVLKAYRRDEVTLAQARPVSSHGSTGLLKLGFGDEFNANNQMPLREAFLKAYEEDSYSLAAYFDGVEFLLQTLQSMHIPFGIVTNKPTQFTHSILRHFPLAAQSGSVVCGDTLKVAKPDPTPLLYAAKEMGVDPLKCWYVGDAERDIIAGREAGMHTVLANYGYLSDEDRAQNWQEDDRIDKVEDLLQLM